MEPVPLKMVFSMPATQGLGYIDISQCASLLSRKFLRQGLNWAVGSVKITMPAASSSAGNAVYISTLQHSWVTANAWKKSQALWQEQQDEAIDDSGSESAVARYRDFKILADPLHETDLSLNLLPVGLGPGTPAGPFPSAIVTTASPLQGEWEPSQIVIPNDGAVGVTNEYYLRMHGASDATTKGIIVGYANSRAFPHSPDPVSPTISQSWMNDMFDVGDDNTQVVDNATNRNDDLPYDQNQYVGGGSNFVEMENQCFAFNSNTIGERQYSFGGFSAPCGLLRVDNLYSSTEGNDIIIEINLMPGHHRGYLAEPMQEM